MCSSKPILGYPKLRRAGLFVGITLTLLTLVIWQISQIFVFQHGKSDTMGGIGHPKTQTATATIKILANSTSQITIENLRNSTKTATSPAANSNTRFPISNILLMGQFNYDTSVDQIQEWVSIWSTYFTYIEVAGPFSNSTISDLTAANISYRLGANDRGYFSPLENLKNSLLDQAAASKHLDAVLYLHDDALLNLTSILDMDVKHSIVANFGSWEESTPKFYYVDLTVKESILATTTATATANQSSEGPRISHYWESYMNPHVPIQKQGFLVKQIGWWSHQHKCLPQTIELLYQHRDYLKAFAETWTTNVTSALSRHRERYFLPHFDQSDFLLVPTNQADLFAQLVDVHLQAQVFLECAFPYIVYWMTMEHFMHPTPAATADSPTPLKKPSYLTQAQATTGRLRDAAKAKALPKVQRLRLCTSWEYEGPKARNTERGEMSMMGNCFKDPEGYGLFHPVKLNIVGSGRYRAWLKQINNP